MSDQTDDGERKASGGKTLSLKRTVDSGQVRQNISHGRSKSVVVETKRKRTIKPAGKPGAADEKAATPTPTPTPTPKPKVVAKKPAAPKPAAPKAAAPAPAPKKDRGSGMVLRTLTEEEKKARGRALDMARVREEEDRKRAEIDAARRAEEEAVRAQEQVAAAKREAEEAKRLKAEEAAKRQAELEAQKRAEVPLAPGEEKKPTAKTAPKVDDKKPRGRPGDAKPATPPTRRVEPRRRTGKLTIDSALRGSDGDRQKSLAAMRRRAEREKKKAMGTAGPAAKVIREVVIPEAITVQELANRMAERAVDVIKILMKQGEMVTINDVIDSDSAQLIAEEMGHTVKRVSEADVEAGLVTDDDTDEVKLPRAPVVTVMGHVDHGKTSLLDALRQTDVVAGEAGGITQHIGAYQVNIASGDKITFLDTPGHEAFTSMRARGAQATDIVILVVAADDGVMPQTIEAINHAKAAAVPIIVAINKCDKPAADPARVKNELLQHEIFVEDMGGDIQAVEVSAHSKVGLDKLEEAIVLQAEILELKANASRPGEGVIVEAKLDKGRGPVGTLLIQRGTLAVGDILVAGAEWGKVRALINDRGESVESGGPSEPVEVLGLNGTPEAGDVFVVVETEARAREVADYRQRLQRDKRVGGSGRTSLDQMLTQLKDADRQDLPIVVKSDVQGSAEAIVQAMEKLGTDEVTAKIIHSGVGGITEADVTLADASGAPVIGFNVRANAQARSAARATGIEIRYYSVIYDLVDDVKAAMSGLLSPEIRETFNGNAEILEVFNISKVGRIAGCKITEGTVKRGSKVRLIRDDVVIHEGTLSTLKRFKDEVKEVGSGQECGMSFENYQDMRVGDVIECFDVESIARSLD
jgi:translation initiation factor IF-2